MASEVKLTSNRPTVLFPTVLVTTEGHPEEPQAGRLQGDHVNQQDPGLPFCSEI